MTRIAYIQANNEEGKPYSPSGAAAALGFAFLGYDVRFFRSAEVMDLPLTPMTVVVGGVRTVQNALEKLGARVPFVSAPSSLLLYMGRACWQTTIGNIREAGQYPVFVKPYGESKVFNGVVLKSESDLESLLLSRTGFPTIGEDFPILAQETVTFVSEWRAFVKHGVVLGMSHYAGDPLLFPSPGVIRLVLGPI